MEIRTIAVIGGGTMGSEIAILTAKLGLKTILIEKNPAMADDALKEITREMDMQIAQGNMAGLEKKLVLTNLHVSDDLEQVKEADLAISALPDDLALNKQVFAQLDAICRPETIFTTNTSMLSITELATVLRHPDKMLGLHFMNPVLAMKLVEIVRGFKTSEETYETGKAFIASLGKEGIEVFETPGFVTTRLILPLLNEAMHALMEKTASAEDIEKAMKLGYGMPAGPLELADRIGLDTLLIFMNHLFRETRDQKFRPCPLLKKLVRAQLFGVKTGEGFFKYDPNTGKRIPILVHRYLW